MDVYKTASAAADLVATRIDHKFWTTRARDMIRHVCLMPSSDGSTPMPLHKVRVDRVAKAWPCAGSITLTRDDGKRFALRMTRKEFKVELIA